MSIIKIVLRKALCVLEADYRHDSIAEWKPEIMYYLRFGFALEYDQSNMPECWGVEVEERVGKAEALLDRLIRYQRYAAEKSLSASIIIESTKVEKVTFCVLLRNLDSVDVTRYCVSVNGKRLEPLFEGKWAAECLASVIRSSANPALLVDALDNITGVPNENSAEHYR